VPHPDVLGGRHLSHKRVDQSGLADTGLPRDDPHLSRALARCGPPLRQLGQGRVSSHKVRWATERGRRQAAWGLLRLRSTRSHQGADRRNEPIAPAVHSLNKLGGAPLIAQHAAELPHGHRDHVLTHDGVGPDRGQQRVFGYELARPGHQAGEDGKGFRGQTDHLVTAPQTFVTEVEPKRSNTKCCGSCIRRPFRVSRTRPTGLASGHLQNFFRNFL
jgi:hypothetical protein